jgi:hypothetical protein
VVEAQRAVVDAAKSALGSAVTDRDTREGVAAVVADRHEDGVNAVASGRGAQLGEDHGQSAVAGCAADVGLGRCLVGSMDDELVGRVVIRGSCLQALHVTSVPHLGHGEAAGQGEGDDVGEIAVVLNRGAQVGDGSAEESPVDARLDEQ